MDFAADAGHTQGVAAEPANPAAALTEAQDRFIAAWGQMGAAWGISRTMAAPIGPSPKCNTRMFGIAPGL